MTQYTNKYRLGNASNGPYSYGLGCAIGIVMFYKIELFRQEHLDIDLAMGPILYFIEKAHHFKKPIPVNWAGARVIKETTTKFWKDLEKIDKESLIVLNNWIAAEPECFANELTTLNSIRFLGLNSPFVQAMARFDKKVENTHTTKGFKIDINRDLKNIDIKQLYCRKCLDSELFGNAKCDCKDLVLKYQKLSK